MKCRGLTLVELMMAMTMSAILIIGAVTVYVRCSAAYALTETIARLQENARYALATLEADIELAGFWGLTRDARWIHGAFGNATLALSSRASRCDPTFPLDLSRPLAGSNNAYALPCAATGGAQDGSDVLIVRHAEASETSASNDRIQLYTTRNGTTSRLFVSDSAPGPITQDAVLGASAQIHDLSARAYYISRSSTGQPNLPSLRRKSLGGGPTNGPDVNDEEVMPGVEDLQVQFGIDPGADADGDGVPDDGDGDGWPDAYTGRVWRYVNPADPALYSAAIITARLWLRMRAEAPEPRYADKTYEYADVNFQPIGTAASYRRLLVSRTFQLRNAVGALP